MTNRQAGRTRGLLLNATLVILGLAVMVLLYAFATRLFMPRVDARREAETSPLMGDIIQVEVRNGCGVDGLAARMTRYLRRQGFDVVEVGDYTSFDQPTSLVIDRVGDLASARKVAAALGISEEHVRQDIQPDYYLDASVIIGRDYTAIAPFDEE